MKKRRDPMPQVPEKYPVWNERCGNCGTKANGLYILECPSCSTEGCPECFPAGRGCECTQCEDKANA